MITLVTLLCVAIVNRLLVVRHGTTSFDTYGHLYFAKKIKEQKSGAFGSILTDVIYPASFSNPFMWNWLVSYMPDKLIIKWQRWVNSLIDAFYAVLLFVVSISIGVKGSVAILITLMYLFTPIFFSSMSIGGRINQFTPRLSSELATSLFFVFTLYAPFASMGLNLLVGVALSFYVFASSKFGRQAILFITVVYTLFDFNLLPLFVLSAGFFAYLLFSKWGGVQSIGEQLSHLSWYYRKNLSGKMRVSNRNSIALLLRRPDGNKSVFRWVGAILMRAIQSNAYTGVLIKFPALILLLVALICGFDSSIDPVLTKALHLSISAVIIYILVNLRWLLFLGESERYLTHVGYFILLSTVVIFDYSGLLWIVYFMIAYGCIYWVVEPFVYKRFFTNKSETDDRLIQDLKDISEKKTILCYPFQAAGGVWRVMLETHHNAFFVITSDETIMDKYEKKYPYKYPFTNLECFGDISKEYQIDVLILDNKEAESQGYLSWKPDGEWIEVDNYNGIYSVYHRMNTIG